MSHQRNLPLIDLQRRFDLATITELKSSSTPKAKSFSRRSNYREIYDLLSFRKTPNKILETEKSKINYLLRNAHSPEVILYNTQRPSIVDFLPGAKIGNIFSGSKKFELIGKKMIRKVKSEREMIFIDHKERISLKLKQNLTGLYSPDMKIKYNKRIKKLDTSPRTKNQLLRSQNSPRSHIAINSKNQEILSDSKADKSIQIDDSSFCLNGWGSDDN